MSQMKSGAVLSYLSILITILIALIYTPIMIRLLGQSEYGLYALIGSLATVFSIMDMGLGNAIVRFTARNRANGDKSYESKLNGLFLILYSIIGFLTILLGVILVNKINTIFGGSLTVSELKKARIMVLILTVNFALSFPLSVFGSIMQAYEKFVVIKLIAIIRSILIPVFTLPFLFLGYGSITMVVVTSIINIVSSLFNVYYCFRNLNISFYFRKIDSSLLKEILGYSFFVFVGVIVDQIYWNTDQFILGIFSGTIPVAVYAIAMLFVRLYIQFSTSLSGLFLPKVSMMVANKASSQELTNIMIKMGRIQYIIMSYILSGFILFGQPFINIWAGSSYSNAYYIVLVIMLPLTIPLIQNIGISILYAKNLQGFRSVILIIIAILNVLISIPLAKSYGGIGVAVATACTIIIGNIIIMNIYYHKKIGINIPLFWKNIFLMSIPVISSIVFGFGINYFIPQNSLFLIFCKIIIFSFFFIFVFWIIGFNKYEKNLFLLTIKSMRNLLLKTKNIGS